MPRMATDDFNKVQRQLKAAASELGALTARAAENTPT